MFLEQLQKACLFLLPLSLLIVLVPSHESNYYNSSNSSTYRYHYEDMNSFLSAFLSTV